MHVMPKSDAQKDECGALPELPQPGQELTAVVWEMKNAKCYENNLKRDSEKVINERIEIVKLES